MENSEWIINKYINCKVESIQINYINDYIVLYSTYY